MDKRIKLQYFLEELAGNRNVYFQPPESVKLRFPAIVYSRDGIENTHANNRVYGQSTMYQITVIDADPDSEIVKKLSMLPNCHYEAHFVVDNRNHDRFNLYI